MRVKKNSYLYAKPECKCTRLLPATMAHPRCDWWLYVYSLPDSYRKRGNHARPASSPASAPWLRDIPQLQTSPLWLTGNYQLGDIILERSLEHPCRTHNATVADLFLVPAWNMDMLPLDRKSAWRWCAENSSYAAAMGGHFAALFARLEAEATGALRRHGGADHILLSPRVGAEHVETWPLCELELADARWGAALRLGIEQYSPGTGSYTAHPLFKSVPRPSFVRIGTAADEASSSSSSSSSAPWAPWAHTHARPTLVAAALGSVSRFGTTSAIGRVRNLIREQCECAPDRCALVLPVAAAATSSGCAAGVGATTTNRTTTATVASAQAAAKVVAKETTAEYEARIARAYWGATFCVQPRGDSARRWGAHTVAPSTTARRRLAVRLVRVVLRPGGCVGASCRGLLRV